MLNIINNIPNGLLETPPTELHTLLEGPTLLHLKGHREQPVFVSVLLHGNETTGYLAIQELLRKYHEKILPRSLSIFIGNVTAARYGERRLEGQVDYNRVWSHNDFQPAGTEANIMRQVVEEMRRKDVFISVDIHNNTGLNPHYACINQLQHEFCQLAVLFSRTVIYFLLPKGVQSQAFTPLCPSVTVECGKTGLHHGTVHALQYIESCLGLSMLPDRAIPHQDMDLFHTVATVKVPEHINFSFTQESADLYFRTDMENLNFSELEKSTQFAQVNSTHPRPLSVINEQGEEVFDRYFSIKNHSLNTACRLMPSMLTIEEDIIKKDCLCYLMERMDTSKLD